MTCYIDREIILNSVKNLSTRKFIALTMLFSFQSKRLLFKHFKPRKLANEINLLEDKTLSVNELYYGMFQYNYWI
jgi:hypothetical protein